MSWMPDVMVTSPVPGRGLAFQVWLPFLPFRSPHSQPPLPPPLPYLSPAVGEAMAAAQYPSWGETKVQ